MMDDPPKSVDTRTRYDAGILLETGTNELEALIFSLDGHPYGINVAKVREVMIAPAIHCLPDSPPAVEGVFWLRERVVPLVSLRGYLGLTPYPPEMLAESSATRVIIAEFNNGIHAFRVDCIERICRLSLQAINPLPRLEEFGNVPVVALAGLDEGEALVPMLDFEMIVAELRGGAILKMPTARAAAGETARASKRIVVAEDSPTIKRLMTRSLVDAGFKQLHVFEDGQQAWDWLIVDAQAGGVVDLVITDIEMPQLDGLRLCRLIRDHEVLKDTPVILFSSLVSDDNRKRGETVGATAQISKPELAQLVDLMESILHSV